MLSNKKGTVLVIAVAAMMIMGIIGFICLQVYTNQNMLDTYDQIRKRTFYSAEGAVEMMRGYLQKKIDATTVNPMDGDVYLYDKTNGKNWAPFTDTFEDYEIFKTVYGDVFHKEDGTLFLKKTEFFDRTIHPGIKVIVFVHRVRWLTDYNLYHDDLGGYWPAEAGPMGNYVSLVPSKYNGLYVIVASAFAEHKSTMGVNTVRTTLRFYFYTKYKSMSEKNEIKWVAWRID